MVVAATPAAKRARRCPQQVVQLSTPQDSSRSRQGSTRNWKVLVSQLGLTPSQLFAEAKYNVALLAQQHRLDIDDRLLANLERMWGAAVQLGVADPAGPITKEVLLAVLEWGEQACRFQQAAFAAGLQPTAMPLRPSQPPAVPPTRPQMTARPQPAAQGQAAGRPVMFLQQGVVHQQQRQAQKGLQRQSSQLSALTQPQPQQPQQQPPPQLRQSQQQVAPQLLQQQHHHQQRSAVLMQLLASRRFPAGAHPLLPRLCLVLNGFEQLTSAVRLPPDMRLDALVSAAVWLLQLGPAEQAVLAERTDDVCRLLGAVSLALQQEHLCRERLAAILHQASTLSKLLAQHVPANGAGGQQLDSAELEHIGAIQAQLVQSCWEHHKQQQQQQRGGQHHGQSQPPPATPKQTGVAGMVVLPAGDTASLPTCAAGSKPVGEEAQEADDATKQPCDGGLEPIFLTMAVSANEARLLKVLRGNPGIAPQVVAFLKEQQAAGLLPSPAPDAAILDPKKHQAAAAPIAAAGSGGESMGAEAAAATADGARSKSPSADADGGKPDWMLHAEATLLRLREVLAVSSAAE